MSRSQHETIATVRQLMAAAGHPIDDLADVAVVEILLEVDKRELRDDYHWPPRDPVANSTDQSPWELINTLADERRRTR